MRIWLRSVVILAVALTGCEAAIDLDAPQQPAAPVQQPAPAPAPDPEADRIERPTSDPYKGDLGIFEGAKRAERLQVDRVMDVLRIAEGSSVADIGAGSGWFTVRAARRVGPTGAVYAVEINEKFLEHISDRARKEELGQVRPVLGTPDDPKLPAEAVDAVLILKTYHEFSEPVVIMRRVAAALRPGGLVGVIDRDGDGDDHGVDGAVVVEELARAGLELVERHDFVKGDDMDYFLVFRRPAAR